LKRSSGDAVAGRARRKPAKGGNPTVRWLLMVININYKTINISYIYLIPSPNIAIGV